MKTEPQKIADGIWFLDGAPMSVLVEFPDHVVVIEAAAEQRTDRGYDRGGQQLVPSKQIRFVVNTHHHFDHSGGVRGYLAAGIPILTHEKNKPYWERILRNPFTLEPDHLARAPRTR